MSEPAPASTQDPVTALRAQTGAETEGKKRKRTGKAREEKKKAAIQAQLEAEAKAEAEPSTGGQIADGPEGEDAKDKPPSPSQATGAPDPTEKPGVDVEQAAKRIPQALKSLNPIFKQAKSFETRRLIKKIKFLRTKPDSKDEVADLEAQLQLLHHVQLHALGQAHLFSKIRKHPSLKHSHGPFPPALLTPLTAAPSSAPSTSTSAAPALLEKVENRLCSSKIVADAVKGSISWIMGKQGAKLALGAKAPKGKQARRAEMDPGRAARLAAGTDSEGEEDDDSEREDGSVVDAAGAGRKAAVVLDDVEGGESDDEAVQQDYAADEVGWESGSVSGFADNDGLLANDSDSDSDSDAISLEPRPSKRSKAAEPKQKAQSTIPTGKQGKSDITSSLFLPSLAAGFTRGDEGDSDPDLDYDPDGTVGTKKAERKNRRGQRARQAIWEKKYGKGAKHVVKRRQEEDAARDKAAKTRQDREFAKKLGRDAGWGAKGAGAVTTAATGSVAESSTPAVASAAPTPGQQAEKKLHPSWEAARLRKQKMGAIPAQAPKANKIVFD